MKNLLLRLTCVFTVLLCLRAEAQVRPGFDLPEKTTKNTLLYADDDGMAVLTFANMVGSNNPDDWEVLIALLRDDPKHYVFLRTNYEATHRGLLLRANYENFTVFGDEPTLKSENRFSNYIRGKAETDENFARILALSWKNGWNETYVDVVPKLRAKDSLSTRRIALEFLKLENAGETFGYEWKKKPTENKAAIAK